jgi:uncharacterized protein (TIGR02679 family)
MNGTPDQRLQRLLGGDDLAGLRARMRRHFERAKPDVPFGILRLAEIAAHEYRVLASLLGRRVRPASSIQVDIATIDAALSRAGIAPSLKAALELLDGPIKNLATTRAEAFSRWDSVVQGARHPDLARLLQTGQGLGLLKRLARQDSAVAARVRDRTDLILHSLPVTGKPRAQVAAEVLGDAHGLDSGQQVATLVLAVLRHSAPKSANAPEIDLLEEERDRAVWARAGVLVNELARPALFLNIPIKGDKPFAAPAGEPGYASLRALLRSPPVLAVAGSIVYVCENANFLAIAADQLGPHCSPLVCTDGMPAAAQRTLLTQLATAGATLLYHGDFDWPGLHIANFVIRSFRAQPWHFCAGDYLAHAINPSGQSLTGKPTAASWDASLAPTMKARGLAIPEEAIAATLLHDLKI